ncbi:MULTISPECIES: DUF547 domain-containing protein [Flavobacteriaceae]|uniref:DUF547 domain-containing protein n=1 Tax=Flavobacteriaceae TaxID=49546 RepID=UPI0014922ACC|nr:MULTISPECIES: DUF547 domain-containing protein [Allomuricauda]MDC6365548.1 DUF547 domain-containing protein [Muricauda sp. AC10]
MNLVVNLFLGIFLLACNNTQEKIESQECIGSSKPEHIIWGNLLQQYVNDDGDVNYAEFKKDETRLDEYLNHLSQNPPATTWSKNEKLAYYINLYNAATVKLILVNHPIESIRDIPNRWKKKWIQVGSITTSLNAIEHKILRKMNEPRIHFAINCASYSCPRLFNVAFTQENMEQLLTKATKDFVNDPKRNRFENGKAKLSKIFKWYKGDFTIEKSLLEYIDPYLENSIDKNASIEYLDYDWSLNESK